MLPELGNVIEVTNKNDIFSFDGSDVVQDQCAEDQIQGFAARHWPMGDDGELLGANIAHGENGLPGQFTNSVEDVFNRLIDDFHGGDFVVRKLHPAGGCDQHGRRGFTGRVRFFDHLGLKRSGARQSGQRGGESEGWQSEMDIHGWY